MPFRAFISADLGAFPRIEAFAEALRDSGGQLKLVDLDLLHATLKFLGDTDEALVPEIVHVMETAVQGVAPVRVTLHGTGVFPSPSRITVVWVGLEGADALAGIAAKLNAGLPELGFPPENRRWLPHVTIARVKGGRNLDRVRAAVQTFADEAFGEATIDRIRLKRSVLKPEGPEYTTVADVPLRG
ncbi:MAG TPA: RNA 2',3'-cyclic phosphodiesterase [Thermoplasmata archaeon]|jgi:2'-5' RNA ligase|nr:RNA 2',3'-cyclic phosphodiesterase [Thermoplasmata archaeon]